MNDKRLWQLLVGKLLALPEIVGYYTQYIQVLLIVAAEYEKRKENFLKELDFVLADVIMALVADFMLVWLPAPTVSLKPPLAVSAGPIAKFFYSCPDNAFQVALSGTSYSFLQRVGAILRNGSKLFGVGTGASLIGTGLTNALIYTRKAFDKDFAGVAEDVPILSTSVAYGVYMAVSSNLRYQILAGIIEQRMLEPLLHNQKLALGALCFAVRTGNTFLGSLMWVDYARWVGVQKVRE
ncbi:Protein RETICULATA-RELATED 4 [Carex littledalei]|uniref:Protein RETICULATA-RELATED 4 n=1 Tax=Carex littledalei TaxID=544730 RepID=A0A833QW08_9POAL|nr:Protein RETICULATA-RELATED 4 [Carex littledalei]